MNKPQARWTGWQKSTKSGNENCVQVAPWGGVRDTKNPGGPELDGLNLGPFFAAIKRGDVS